MMIQGVLSVFLAGTFGGFLVELLRWYRVKDSLQFPEYATRLVYWLLTILMILAGGALAVLYGTGPINAITAVNLGASAPALIGALSTPPKTARGGGGKARNGAQSRTVAKEKTRSQGSATAQMKEVTSEEIVITPRLDDEPVVIGIADAAMRVAPAVDDNATPVEDPAGPSVRDFLSFNP